MALNLNIGILGHVDSGKTSIAKCLSTVASTAAFDKNPQSQERKITLDLGFSAFTVPIPDNLKGAVDVDYVQYTLVDCPGHASLIKTIIGGAQIIDMMLLVIDITKGVQTQTAECLIIGEITCKRMIVVLNKIDMLDSKNRNVIISKMIKKIEKTLSTTSYKEVPFIPVSALPDNRVGIEDLIKCICDFTMVPQRSREGNFLFAIDHCFGIRGQGTVLTGTILEGAIDVNDIIEIPQLGTTKKIKSMQMFKKPVSNAMQGDRLGICVTHLDPKSLERGMACAPGYGQYVTCAIIKVNPIKYFKTPVESKSKFHITIGHETTLSKITVFESDSNRFSFDNEYLYCDILDVESKEQFLCLELERPVFTVCGSIAIGSKLDMDIHKNDCRLAFWGTVIEYAKNASSIQDKLNIYKKKRKVGVVDRIVNENTLIVKNMFKKETNLQKFMNLKVYLSSGDVGVIESSFGKSGKVKVTVANGIKGGDVTDGSKIEVVLEFKTFIFDINKNISQ